MPSMMMSVVALALLTLFVYAMITVLGVTAKMSGKLSDDYSKNKTGSPPPDWLANWGRNLVNLCELPVLFYALAAFQMLRPETMDELQVTLAAAFVASRYAHTLIHVTINNVGLRFLAHRAGFVILAVMWVRFGMEIMSAGG
jgi:hypothetical protein